MSWKILFCTVCKTTTKTACGYCYEPYCNIECQIIDWSKHRKVCEPLTLLTNTNKDNAVSKQNQEKAKESLLMKDSSAALQESIELSKNKNFIEELSDATQESIEFSMGQFKKEFLKEESTKLSFDHCVSALQNTKFSIDDLEIIHLREGKKVKVVIIDTTFLESYIVSVMDNEKQSRFDLNYNLTNLSKYCDKVAAERRGYAPKLNEMCLAIYDYDQQWYRTFCIKELHNGFLLQFVDFGNVTTVLANNIMAIDVEMMFPACTHLARMTNIQRAYFGKFRRYIKQRPQIVCDIYFDKVLAVHTIAIENLESMLDF